MIDKSYWKSGFLIGLCLFAACFTQTIGVMLEMPGKSLFLSSAYCVFVPFLTWLLLKKRPKITHIIAAFLCTAGIENIIGLIFGALLFNEKFTTRSIIGFILMFTAIIVAENLGTTKSVPPA